MKRVYGTILVGLAAWSAGFSQINEKKFSIYGFMDMQAVKTFMPDNSLFRASVGNGDFDFNISHINLYFDLKPNNRTRFLTEIAFRDEPLGHTDQIGRAIRVTTGDRTDVIPAGEPGLAESNEELDLSQGSVLEWGSFGLERAWLEYRHNQYVNLRMGKFITPAGIWNVDHGSPVITTVRQPYQTGLIAIFPESQIGIMDKGMMFIGDADLDWSAYVSTGRDGIKLEEIKDLAGGGHIGVALPVLDGLNIGFSGYTGMQKAKLTTQYIDVEINSETLLGLTMEAMAESGSQNPYDADVQALLQQKISEYVGSWVGSKGLDPKYHTYEDEYVTKSRDIAVGGDIKLSIRNFTWQAEVNHQILRNYLNPEDHRVTTHTGVYTLFEYGIPLGENLKLTPYVMYERIIAKDADNNPHTYLSGRSSGGGEQIIEGFQTYLGGLNLKLNTNITLKVEYLYADLLMTGAMDDLQDAMDLSTLYTQFSIAF